VAIAPQVAGVIQSVAVHDNEKVRAGDLVAVIDPQFYLLDVRLKTQRIASLQALVAVKSQQQEADIASRDAASSAFDFAKREYDRIKALIRDQVVAQERFDKAQTICMQPRTSSLSARRRCW
jgi:membrane fusion protein (multidrug efflux system)